MNDIKKGAVDQEFTIECEDVLLIEYRLQDLDSLVNLTQQPEIYEYLPDWRASREQRLDWMINYEIPENKRFLQATVEDGEINELCLRMGIILKETGEFIGWCCTGMKEELPAPNREVMYAISRNHRNKGYTTQAVNGLTKFLFEHTNISELNAIALLRNVASNKVIEKSGFTKVGAIEIDGESYHHYKLYR